MLNPAMRAFPYSVDSVEDQVDPFADDVLIHLTGVGENAQTGMANMAGYQPFTNVGATTISTDQAKYGTTAVKFPGTGTPYITYNGSLISGLASGLDDFTLEAWVYATTTGTYRYIYAESKYNTGANQPQQKRLHINTNNRLVWKSDNIISDTDFPANEWVHVAVCRASGTTRMFQNGVLVGSLDESTISYLVPGYASPVATDRPIIGASKQRNYPLVGYIEDLRFTAAARYTAAFTPPTAALPLVSAGTDPHWSNVTLLLMNQNETNGSQTFTDLSNSGHTIQPYNNGTAAWQTTQVVAGSAAVGIPTNNSLHVPTEVGTGLTFGTGDFTIDFMVRVSNTSTTKWAFDFQNAARNANALSLALEAGNVKVQTSGGSGYTLVSSTTLTANRWHHIRVGRDSGTLKLFIDKAASGSVANATNYVGLSASGLRIGIRSDGNYGLARDGTAFIDCFRVTKGVFRDPANEADPPLRRYQTG